MEDFPFRFYGRAPGDWFEGANDGHGYEIAFAAEPDADARRAFTRTLVHQLASGPARAGGAPWLWSGRFVRLDIGERWLGAVRAAFGQLAGVLVTIHRTIAPIAQVIFFGAREPGDGAWDAASVAAQPDPDPGPPYEPPIDLGIVAYPRATDPALPIAKPDPDVEALREEIQRDISARKARERVAKASDKTPMSAFPAERVAEHAAAQPRLSDAQRARFQIPDPLVLDGKHTDGEHPVDALVALPCAKRFDRGQPRGLVYLDHDGARREVTGLPPQDDRAWYFGNLRGPWLRPDGDAFWIAVGKLLYEVHVRDGVARETFTASHSIGNLHLLPDGNWLLVLETGLTVIDPRDHAVRDHQKTTTNRTIAVLGGELLLAENYMKKQLEAWGYHEGALKRLRTYGAPLMVPREVDGEIVCEVGYSKEWVSLDGLDELFATWKAKQNKPKRAPRKQAQTT